MESAAIKHDTDNSNQNAGTPSTANSESNESTANTPQDAKKKRTGPKRRKVTHGKGRHHCAFNTAPNYCLLFSSLCLLPPVAHDM